MIPTSGDSSINAIDAVEVYWRPGCPFCGSLRRGLARAGVATREVDIWQDPSAAARIRAVAGGNETVPTVFVGGHALVAPRVGQVLDAIARHAPHLKPPADGHRQAGFLMRLFGSRRCR